MAEKLPFLNLFTAFRPDAALAALLGDVLVRSANIDGKARTLDAILEGPQTVGALLSRLEGELASAYQLVSVRLRLEAVPEEASPARDEVPPVWEQEPPPEPEYWTGPMDSAQT